MLLAQPFVAVAGGPDTADIFGVWGSLTLQGDFKSFSPDLDKVKWVIMNQSRTKDDSSNGSRLSENLLFGQVGYQLTPNASFWAGYVHDWIKPLDKVAYQENRPYQDFQWNQSVDGFNFTARTRFEQRMNQNSNTGPQDIGLRARQLIQVSHAMPFIDGLSAYVGDEVLGYVNQNGWGKQGFSENRIMSGLSYQFTPAFGGDLGYLGQYTDTLTGNNTITHNIQANVRYKF